MYSLLIKLLLFSVVCVATSPRFENVSINVKGETEVGEWSGLFRLPQRSNEQSVKYQG